MSIYLSEWSPRGVRKDWERCSISNADALRLIGDFADGNVTDACCWFDSDESLRVLVADTDTGRRFIMRNTKKHRSLTIGYTGDPS